MDAEDFKRILSRVLRDELGVSAVEMAGRWEGGEMILKPGKEGLQEKRIPLDALFHKIIMIRDRLRVLEQKINTNPKLAPDEKNPVTAIRHGLLRVAHDVQRSLCRP